MKLFSLRGSQKLEINTKHQRAGKRWIFLKTAQMAFLLLQMTMTNNNKGDKVDFATLLKNCQVKVSTNIN